MSGDMGMPTAQKIPEVAVQTEQLKKEIEICLKRTSELEQRLGGVLKPTPSTASALQEDKKSPVLVPLAQQLRSIVEQVRHLATWIKRIKDNIEV